jgi:TP901 family phage tail tape measure protein
MAMSARELLLIIRAQNQASAALRRVAGDMRGLGRIQDLNIRRNQLAINQANSIRQQMRAEAALADITSGRRRIQAEQERVRILDRQLRLQESIRTATERRALTQQRITKLTSMGAAKESIQMRSLLTQRVAYTRQIRNYKRQLDTIPAALEAQTGRMKNLNMQASRLRGELRTIAQRMVVGREKMRLLDKEISAARWDKAVFGARAFAHAGRIAQLAGLGAGAGLAYLANTAADFEQRAMLVATQTGRVGTGFERIIKNSKVLGTSILRVMADSTSSMEEVEAAAYDIFSSLTLPQGGRGLKVGADMLKLMSDAAIAGMTDVETVTDGVVAAMGAFEEIPRTGAGVTKILNRMFAAVRFGRMTFAEFASTLGTTAPAARAAGQTLDTMAGTIAFLSRPLGVNKAAVGFARLTEILGRKKFVDNLKASGVAITDTSGRMKQMPDIIDLITRRFPKLTKGGTALTQFFKEMSGTEGTIQARRAFVFLAQQMDQYRTVLNQTVKDNNEFDRSLKAMSETAGVKWKKAMNTLRVLGIEIGAAVIPTLIDMLEPVQDLVKWFQNLDPEVKKQIGRWAAWGAALLLVGGTLALIGGTVAAMLATLLRMGILFRTMSVAVIAASVAIAALTGDLDSLKDIGNELMNFFSGSWEGFAAGAVIAALAVTRLSTAMRGLAATRTTTLAASAAGVIGPSGFLPMLIRAPGNIRAYGSAVRESAKGTNMAAKAFRAAGAGVALLPGPLKLAAVGIAAFGVGALLWNRRASAMRQEADELAKSQQELATTINNAAMAAGRFKGLGPSITDFKRAKLEVQEINAQIKELRKQMKGTEGDERASLKRAIARLILDRADAMRAMGAAAGKANTSLRAFNDFMGKQSIILDQVARKESRIREIRKEITEINQQMIRDQQLTPPSRLGDLQKELRQTKIDIEALKTGSAEATAGMVDSFTQAIRDLQAIGEMPRRISNETIRDALQLQVKMGRLMTRKEMRLFFKAAIDPKSLRQLPAEIRRFLRGRQRERVQIAAEVKINRQKLTQDEKRFQAARGVDFEAVLKDGKAKKQVQNLMGWFKANSTLPPFKASISPSGVSMGIALAQGIESGFGTLDLNVTITKQIKEVRRQQGIKSPSKVWMKQVGVPIGQGVVVGMLMGMNNITSEFKRGTKKWRDDIRRQLRQAFNQVADDAGSNMMDRWKGIRDELSSMFFTGIGEINELRVEWGVVLRTRDLTANLRTQIASLKAYNANWNNLVGKGVPLKLLQQLQAMGAEGQAIIAALASGSSVDLQAYVKAWREAQKLLDKVAKAQMNQQIRLWRRMGRNIAFGIMSGLRSEEQGMLNYFERLFRRMFGRAVRFNRSRSPSKRYEREGRNIIRGLERGLGTGMGLTVPQPAIGRGVLRGRSIRTGTGSPINMTVNAHHDESLMTTLEKARFRLKNRT